MTRHESQGTRHSLSRYWLLIGVTALAVAGLFSLVLVVARTPSLADLPLVSAMFHKALVVHVDLSVLVWFLSIACMMWSVLASGSRCFFPLIEEAALISFALGTLLLAVSPVDGKGEALMSNYIPVITSPLFFLGLALVMCGVVLMLVRVLLSNKNAPLLASPLQGEGIYFGAVIAAIAVMAFVWSYRGLGHDFAPEQYYELLFWGGGHTLQFLHTQMAMVCWVVLVASLRGGEADAAIQSGLLRCARNDRILRILFSIGLIAALVVPIVYLKYDINSAEHRNFFTQAMIMAGGIAPMLLALMIIPGAWKLRAKNALSSTLLMSLLLFIYGGILGGMIAGQNVVIPAHYHGSIVGVTLAFMGAAYVFLPKFGYRDPANWRLAFWQPIIYGGGQLLHISGLAWSGGYGVLRKTPGGMDGLSAGVKAAMGLMGLGGMIAIIGGFMFVIVVWKSVKR